MSTGDISPDFWLPSTVAEDSCTNRGKIPFSDATPALQNLPNEEYLPHSPPYLHGVQMGQQSDNKNAALTVFYTKKSVVIFEQSHEKNRQINPVSMILSTEDPTKQNGVFSFRCSDSPVFLGPLGLELIQTPTVLDCFSTNIYCQQRPCALHSPGLHTLQTAEFFRVWAFDLSRFSASTSLLLSFNASWCIVSQKMHFSDQMDAMTPLVPRHPMISVEKLLKLNLTCLPKNCLSWKNTPLFNGRVLLGGDSTTSGIATQPSLS